MVGPVVGRAHEADGVQDDVHVRSHARVDGGRGVKLQDLQAKERGDGRGGRGAGAERLARSLAGARSRRFFHGGGVGVHGRLALALRVDRRGLKSCCPASSTAVASLTVSGDMSRGAKSKGGRKGGPFDLLWSSKQRERLFRNAFEYLECDREER